MQSSWSSSEQYMGLCPMVMIHGRTALFSGLLASCVTGDTDLSQSDPV